MDNSYVVPYNAVLSLLMNCHMNVEWIASLKCIQYLFKYQFKGSDQATITLNGENDNPDDEVRQYQNKRYVSSMEASFRELQFPQIENKPAILRLPIHLENEQRITYDPSNPEQVQQALQHGHKTMLTAYFEANMVFPEARAVKYKDFPEKFVFQQRNKVWTMRQRDTEIPSTIGRVRTIHPSQEETFCLRMLLNHSAGFTSFNNVKVVNGEQYQTYKAACIAKNLLQNDNMWMECLEEACHRVAPSVCRSLFIFILKECHPANPRALYNQFLEHLRRDYKHSRIHQDRFSDDIAEQYATNDVLCDIEVTLNEINRSNDDFGLPQADLTLRQNLDMENAEHDPNAQQYYDDHVEEMNGDQSQVFQTITNAIDLNQGGFYFIDASGGTGKTFLLNLMLSFVQKDEYIAIACASSGIAGTLLTNGTTAHNRFKFPIPIFDDSTCSIPLNSNKANMIKHSKLIVIDEVSMLHHYNLDALERFLRALMQNESIFGGKLVVICGDFRQILPVIPRGSRADIIQACLKSSALWNHVTKLRLTINMRVQRMLLENPTEENRVYLQEYSDWLLSVGEGTVPTVRDNIIQLDPEIVCDTPTDVLNEVYDDFGANAGNANYFKDRAVLAATNDIVDTINKEMLQKVDKDLVTYQSLDSVIDPEQAANYPEEFLNTIEKSGLPQHMLELKKGSVIILGRNLDVKRGHCNGTRYIVLDLSTNLITARRLHTMNENELVLIPRIANHTKEGEFPFIMKRLQFPVRLAYAITFNRAQGQSLQRCGIILPQSVWTHGQLYVGLSRCGDKRNLKIYVNQAEFIEMGLPQNHTYVRNTVYKELFE